MSEMLYDLFLLAMLFAVFAVGLSVVSAAMHVVEWVADELRRARDARARKRRLAERARRYHATLGESERRRACRAGRN